MLESANRGYVHFPGDTKYAFEFDDSEGVKYWDSRDSNNKWMKHSEGIAGEYGFAQIRMDGITLLGQWAT